MPCVFTRIVNICSIKIVIVSLFQNITANDAACDCSLWASDEECSAWNMGATFENQSCWSSYQCFHWWMDTKGMSQVLNEEFFYIIFRVSSFSFLFHRYVYPHQLDWRVALRELTIAKIPLILKKFLWILQMWGCWPHFV